MRLECMDCFKKIFFVADVRSHRRHMILTAFNNQLNNPLFEMAVHYVVCSSNNYSPSYM